MGVGVFVPVGEGVWDGKTADGVQLGVGGRVSVAGKVSVAGGEGEGVPVEVELGRVVDVSVGVKVGNGVRWGTRRVG